ncbi:MarR family transcriptional regulator [bacterium]|nr:MarR family transcriptional regulator [bacterium]
MTLRQDWIQEFGEAYQLFGLPKLMGHVVGLLLASSKPLSLDDITSELGVSKGPVSQVMGRLRDHRLVHRHNKPGNRKDFYEADSDIFGHAFGNHAALLRGNLTLAKRFHKRLDGATKDEIVRPGKEEDLAAFTARIEEMEQFYSLMMKHLGAFMKEWDEVRGLQKSA